MTEHVAYPCCYCVDCVEGAAKPLGWINAEMLNRKREFAANGIVMFDRPCGTAGMPVYAEPPSARITGDKDRGNPVEGAPHTPLGAALVYAQARITALEAEIARKEEAIHMAMLELGSHGACPACLGAHSILRNTLTALESKS